MMKLLFSDNKEMNGSDVSSYLTTFKEFNLGQTALTGYVNKWIFCFVVMIKGKLVSLIYFIIYKQIWS